MNDADDRKQTTSGGADPVPFSGSDADGEQDPTAAEEIAAQPCMPCHGSGEVISNLGEQTRKITCPWCRGGGIRLTDVDAQEFRQEQVALKGD